MSSHSIAITVAGHAERDFTPNRCTVRLRMHADGESRDEAATAVATAAATVTELVTALSDHEENPIKKWGLDQVQHTRHRPYSADGEKKPWVYQSSAAITVTFTDFRAVGPFVSRVADVDAVAVEHLRWWLSRKARAKKAAKVRRLAVIDAIEKAQGYTETLGFGQFHAVAVADAGLLGSAPAPVHAAGATLLRAASAPLSDAGGTEIGLNPEPITMSADVEARFEAS